MEETPIFKPKMPDYMKKKQYNIFNNHRTSIVPYSTDYILSQISYFEQSSVKNLYKYLKSINYPLLYKPNKKNRLIDVIILELPDTILPFDKIDISIIENGYMHQSGSGMMSINTTIPKQIPVDLPIFYIF